MSKKTSLLSALLLIRGAVQDFEDLNGRQNSKSRSVSAILDEAIRLGGTQTALHESMKSKSISVPKTSPSTSSKSKKL
jgi:hypothetical protein